jgi:hypothetical protein
VRLAGVPQLPGRYRAGSPLRSTSSVTLKVPGQGYLDAAVPLNAKTVTVSLPAPFRPTMADVVPIVEIDALGYRRTLVSPQQDCST